MGRHRSGRQREPLLHADAARLLALTPRALEAWRTRGGGPPFVHISSRAVRYRRNELVAWVDQRIRRSTSDPGPDAA